MARSSSHNNSAYVRAIVREAERVNANRRTAGGAPAERIKVLPWVWYRYLRFGTTEKKSMLAPRDMHSALAGPGTRGSNDVGVRAGPGTRGSNDDDNDDHALLKAPHHLTATPLAAVAARSKAMAAFVSPTFAVPRPQRSPSSARRSTRRSASAGLLLGVRYGEGLGLHTITLAAAGAEPEDTDADNGLDGVRQLAPSSSLKHLMLVGEKAARSPDVPRWDLPER